MRFRRLKHKPLVGIPAGRSSSPRRRGAFGSRPKGRFAAALPCPGKIKAQKEVNKSGFHSTSAVTFACMVRTAVVRVEHVYTSLPPRGAFRALPNAPHFWGAMA